MAIIVFLTDDMNGLYKEGLVEALRWRQQYKEEEGGRRARTSNSWQISIFTEAIQYWTKSSTIKLIEVTKTKLL